MNVAMWGKALRVIPRVNKDEWDRLDVVSRWLISTRAAVFVMTAFSAMVGGVLAFRDGAFDLARFVVCLLGLVLAHATNNLMNDLTDSLTGVDKNNYFRTLYGPQPVEHGLVSLRAQIATIVVTGLLAASCGAFLAWSVGISIVYLVCAGAFFVLFYTWPLKHIGLGEPAVLLVWGPLMIGGTYLAVAGRWSTDAAIVGSIYALGPTTVLFGKHTDKLVPDREKGIHTLPVVIGETASRFCVIVMMTAQPVLVVAAVALGYLRWPMLVVALGLPTIARAVKVFMKPRPTEKPESFPAQFWPTYLAGFAFRTNRITGALFFVGLVGDAVVTRFFR
jgi:1,4-dihydroxy-2-naphthoate octaprenyltransferase